MSQPVMRYSEAFKQQVVDDLESGRFGSPYETSQAYGVDQASVKRWAKQYGKAHLLRKVVRVAKPDEPGEIKKLKDRLRIYGKLLRTFPQPPQLRRRLTTSR